MITQFVDFLRERRPHVVRKVDVLEERWSPTYGLLDPEVVSLEVIDFDALCGAIDEFSQTLQVGDRA